LTDPRVAKAHQSLPRSLGADNALWIALILLLAAGLRIAGLNGGLWYDEIDTLVRYVRLPTWELMSSYDSLNNHMFFSLQAKLSIALFGESPWALRLPAMLMGLASIWALWRLARAVVSPEKALLAALLMTVSYHHVWFSQNARGYTGMLFFGLLATQLLIRGLREPKWRTCLGYGLCLALAMYTHLSSAFFFFAHGLAYLLWLVLPGLRGGPVPAGAVIRPIAGVVAGVLLTVALYAPVLGQMGATFGGVQAGPATAEAVASIAHWQNPLWTIAEMAASLGPLLAPLAPIAVIVIGVGAVALGRRGALIPLTLVLHIGATTALLVALGFRIWPRYYFSDIGFICLLLIVGAFAIGDRWMPRMRLPQLGRALAVAGILASLVLLPKNYEAPKQDFVGARDFVEASRSADSDVITLGLSVMPFAAYYAPDWTGVQSLAEFQAAYDPTRETWVVYTFPDVIERRHADIFAVLAGRFTKARYFPGTLSGGGVVVLKSDEN
jgi:4-amino-4-deoxy-L-arabinose transferase-like glycosyltransferase